MVSLTKFFLILFFTAFSVYAEDAVSEASTDADSEVIEAEFDVVTDTLKIEANHNVERLKSFPKEAANNRIFENEREKGLGEFLEEQEKWDLIRERGLREYKKQKSPVALDERSEAYKKDLAEKAAVQKNYEKSRDALVRTRNKIRAQQPQFLAHLEAEELQIFIDRPRYDVRKKRKNKWISSVGKPGSSGGQGFQNTAAPPPINDFVPPPPPPDFPAAPAPYEGFEELPPPPVYDSNMNTGVPYDPSFGGEMAIPPPPPPPPDYNF